MRAESLYSLLPVSLQSMALSAKGWQFHQQRYRSRAFQETSEELRNNERLSRDALAELQFERFREFASHCYLRSPYYHRVWKSHGVHPSDMRTPEDVRLAPVIAKQEMRAHTREFFTEPIKRGMAAVHTSGTTGSPLTVYFSTDDIGRRYAFLERCRRWAGVKIGQRRASFTGRNLVPQRQVGSPFWRHNYPGNQVLFSSYHLSPKNLPAYVEALNRLQPEIIDGYPSAIHIVAEHVLRHRISLSFQVRAVMTSAETVLPYQRETIEQAFQAKLYNQYASSEGAPFISECRYGQLHVHVDSGLIEILDANGDAARPGETGRMVVTSFTTHVVPMLRFEIGDAAIPTRSSAPCPCGLPFPMVDAIVGRVDDVLYTPDRGLVGRMDTVFKGIPNSIVEAQIIQTSADTVVLRVVPDHASYHAEHAHQIVAEMRRKLGDVVAISVEEVESIPRSANGKMRAVLNLCQDASSIPFREHQNPPTSARMRTDESGVLAD